MGNTFATMTTICMCAMQEDTERMVALENGRDTVKTEVMAEAVTSRSSSLIKHLVGAIPTVVQNPWVANALQLCKDVVANSLMHAADSMMSATIAADLDVEEEEEELMNSVFAEFDVVFEPNVTFQAPTPEFLVPSSTIVVKIDDEQPAVFPAISKTKRMDEDVEDCASCTTEATDMLSEEDDISKSMMFDNSESEDDDESADENDEDNEAFYDPVDSADQVHHSACVARASQLLTTTSDLAIDIEDYLCPCGECPQYKAIERDVALLPGNVRHSRQLVRILQAFSTYNEVIGYRRPMIDDAAACLSVWSGDEVQAFKAFVLLNDEVPRLCAMQNARQACR